MRGMLGLLCHGTPRRAREPYGVVAPALRLLAATATFVFATGGLAVVGLLLLEQRRAAGITAVVAVIALLVAGAARLVAMGTRPTDLAHALDMEQRW